MKYFKMNTVIFIIFLILNSVISAQSQVSKNVLIPEDSIYIKSLDRYRKIRLYLPPDYHHSEKSYPVLYMTDAQNLFDPKTSYVGEWNVDEMLDSLYKSDGLELIVVGMDHGNVKRMNEYSPWENKRFGKEEGKKFMEFVVNELKPKIDKEYRTRSDNKNTGIMGSSMGGLISHYALFEYPHVFSKAGIFSPSYWFSKKVIKFTKESEFDKNQTAYILIEGTTGRMIKDVKKMEKLLIKKGFNTYNLKVIIDLEAKHNEAFWRKYFPDAVKFLFSD